VCTPKKWGAFETILPNDVFLGIMVLAGQSFIEQKNNKFGTFMYK